MNFIPQKGSDLNSEFAFTLETILMNMCLFSQPEQIRIVANCEKDVYQRQTHSTEKWQPNGGRI